MRSKQDLALEKSTGGGQLADPRPLQEMWFRLSGRGWSSLVLVPAHPGGSAEEVARSLADTGKQLADYPVTAITVRVLGPSSARALALLAQQVRRRQDAPLEGVRVIEPGADDPEPGLDSSILGNSAQLIVAVPPVVTEPLGLAVTHAADAVILVVEQNRTMLRDARRTIELIGRDRIAGSVVLESSG